MNNKSKYNPAKHHRRSIRLQGYDYSREGLYFITLCVHNRECLFGEISNGEMILNEYGCIANNCWKEIPDHYPSAVLHAHVIIPNHIHGVIELVGAQNSVGTQDFESNGGVQNIVVVQHFGPRQRNELQRHQYQKIIPRSIGSIIRGYKIGVTKWFRNNTDIHTVWQRNYYEHIIRDETAYNNIIHYIENNPLNWDKDSLKKGKAQDPDKRKGSIF